MSPAVRAALLASIDAIDAVLDSDGTEPEREAEAIWRRLEGAATLARRVLGDEDRPGPARLCESVSAGGRFCERAGGHGGQHQNGWATW